MLAMRYLMDVISNPDMTLFFPTTEKEVYKKDKVFFRNIMKMDWRDRPIAAELPQGKWFDTRNEVEMSM